MNKQQKQLLILLLVMVVTIGVFLSVKFLKQRQTTSSHASQATVLSFSPTSSPTSPIQKNLNDPIAFDVVANPGTNLISLVKLEIDYDPTVLAPADTNPFVSSTAMSQVMEGPVYQTGKVLVTLSVGADPTKAISTTTTIASFNFKSLSGTSAPTAITFGPITTVTSIDANSSPQENVLSSTIPAYLAIAAPTPTPTVTSTPAPTATNTPAPTITNTPTPTRTPTPTTTPIPPTATPIPTNTPTLTPTPTVTNTPTPTRTPTPTLTNTPTPTPVSTRLAVNILLDGIGNAGDNANPTDSSFSNKNPLTIQRSFRMQIFDSTGTLITTNDSTGTYNSTIGGYQVTHDLGSGFTTGTYTVKVKTTGFLQRQVPGFLTITQNQTQQLAALTLVSGDLNDDNKLSLLDYNILRSCYGSTPDPSCTTVQRKESDMNDDGSVDIGDLNLFLREMSVQYGN